MTSARELMQCTLGCILCSTHSFWEGKKHYFQRCYLMKVELDECKWTHSLNHIFQATRINMAIEHLTNALNNEMN